MSNSTIDRNIPRIRKSFRTNIWTENMCWNNDVNKFKLYPGFLNLLMVGRTVRGPLAVKQRGMERRCLARHNNFDRRFYGTIRWHEQKTLTYLRNFWKKYVCSFLTIIEKINCFRRSSPRRIPWIVLIGDSIEGSSAGIQMRSVSKHRWLIVALFNAALLGVMLNSYV